MKGGHRHTWMPLLGDASGVPLLDALGVLAALLLAGLLEYLLVLRGSRLAALVALTTWGLGDIATCASDLCRRRGAFLLPGSPKLFLQLAGLLSD